MFETPTLSSADKPTLYRELLAQVRSIMAGERDRIANAANFAALIHHAVPQLNWCGFYFFDGVELVVGPFQGKPACVRIALGKGVCGTCWRGLGSRVPIPCRVQSPLRRAPRPCGSASAAICAGFSKPFSRCAGGYRRAPP